MDEGRLPGSADDQIADADDRTRDFFNGEEAPVVQLIPHPHDPRINPTQRSEIPGRPSDPTLAKEEEFIAEHKRTDAVRPSR